MAKLDLKSLFVRDRYVERPGTGYKTLTAELDAVQVGKKAMSCWTVDRSWTESQHCVDVHREAHRRDLMLVLDPDRRKSLEYVRVFILRHREMWRIPAFRALWDTAFEDGGWTSATEAQMSLLLGYTAKQRAAWMKHLRWERAADAFTYYALLTKSQRAEVVALGQKAFRTPAGMTIFENTKDCGMKRNAASMVPKDITIARFAMNWMFGSEIVGKARPDKGPVVVSGIVREGIAARLNAELRSKIQFLGRRGWS